MNPDADLSLHALADLLAEFVERLDLDDVTLVGDRLGRPAAHRGAPPRTRSPGLVLLPEEAFDNIPPGLPGTFAGLAGRMPGGVFSVAQTLRVPFVRRLPMTFGWMAKRPIPKETLPAGSPASAPSAACAATSRSTCARATTTASRRPPPRSRDFERPTLVLWATEDRVMPPEHGRRLAAIIPNARHVEIDDCYTLLPLDQPDPVADHIARFAASLA